jgi:hypothetical protein
VVSASNSGTQVGISAATVRNEKEKYVCAIASFYGLVFAQPETSSLMGLQVNMD